MRIAIEGGGYDSAAEALFGGNQLAALHYDSLTGSLGGYGAMAGDDATSEEFAREYDNSTREAVGAIGDLVDALASLGALTSASVTNHRNANASSVYNKPAPLYDGTGGLPADGPVDVAAYTPPSSLGGDNEDYPDFWNEIQDHLEGFAWPNANTGTLREAGTTWRAAGSDLATLTRYCDTAVSMLDAQKSPEIPFAVSAIRELKDAITELGTFCTDIGDSCDAYADEVETQRDVIKGIVRDMAIEAGISIVAGTLVGFFTFGGGAAAGAAIAGWRIVAAARKILAALRALKAAAKARAVLKLTAVVSRAKPLRSTLLRFKRARSVRTAPRKIDKPARVNGKYPPTGRPNSYGYDENGNLLPYADGRPGYGNGQVDEVWDNMPKDENGDVWVLDKNGDPVRIEWEPGQPRRDVWDMGHQEGREYRDLVDQYLNHEISKEEFLQRYRNADNYEVQDPGRNRSHVDEKK